MLSALQSTHWCVRFYFRQSLLSLSYLRIFFAIKAEGCVNGWVPVTTSLARPVPVPRYPITPDRTSVVSVNRRSGYRPRKDGASESVVVDRGSGTCVDGDQETHGQG